MPAATSLVIQPVLNGNPTEAEGQDELQPLAKVALPIADPRLRLEVNQLFQVALVFCPPTRVWEGA